MQIQLQDILNKFSFDYHKIIDVLKFDSANPLLFNTGLFLVLFAAFILIYRLLQRRRTIKYIFVILFSLYFYYKSSAEYCFILLGVCISDYLLGIWLGRTTTNWKKHCIVALNILLNIGMLTYFKYFNLILETISTFGSKHFDALDIILPAGISFFTFRSISYMVDIYRGTIKPCKNFLAYTFYLTFFPPLLAGPVVRAKDMLPQIERNQIASRTMVSEGLFLIICGLVKKVIVADFIGQNFVDRVFDNPSLYSGFENIVGIYGFTLQLYCDFSGYSDIAIGIALLLGFRFFDNFRSPFKAQSPTEFWHRWHISLSTWLRDYVYIPLGGNRCSRFRKNANLMTTMLVGGIWHGASWMFLIWGGLHGAFLVVHKGLKRILPRPKEISRFSEWRKPFNIFLTFNLIAFSMIFFRAESLDKVKDMFVQIGTNFHFSVISQFVSGYYLIVFALLLGYIMHFFPERATNRLKVRFHCMPLILQALILALFIFIIIQVRQSDIVPFIYLQY